MISAYHQRESPSAQRVVDQLCQVIIDFDNRIQIFQAPPSGKLIRLRNQRDIQITQIEGPMSVFTDNPHQAPFTQMVRSALHTFAVTP